MPKTNQRKERQVNVRLPEVLAGKGEAYATARGLNLSEFVRLVLIVYMDQNSQEGK